MTDWATEREVASQAAKQAGQLLMDWAGRFSVAKKGRNDLVTEADHAAQALIRQVLLRRFPDDAFLGEEGGDPRSQVGPDKRRWIVDPLDGTTNYVHHFPAFCVSIGLEFRGRMVVGVVYDPVRKEMFASAEGAGAFLNGVAYQVSTTTELTDSLLAIGLPAVLNEDSPHLRVFGRLSEETHGLRRLGSAALSLAYVSAGRLDGFFALQTKPWDAAGGAALVAHAGGRVSNFPANGYNVLDPTIVATNGLLHDRLCNSLAAFGAAIFEE